MNLSKEKRFVQKCKSDYKVYEKSKYYELAINKFDL